MSDFKSEYKRAVDRLEPDSRLLEALKADMKAAAEAPYGNLQAPPKPNFFVRYRWAFGSVAACLVLALAVGVFLSLGNGGLNMMSEGGSSANMAAENDYLAENAPYGYGGDDNGGMYDESASTFNEVAADNDAPSGGAAITTTSFASGTEVKPESADDEREPTEEAVGEINADAAVTDKEVRFFPVLGVVAERIDLLRALNYDELKTLVTISNESGLTISDFMLYDYIEETSGAFYLVMRYDDNGVSCPLVAVFSQGDPGTPLVSLIIFFVPDYPDYYSYIDLSQMSVEDFEYYFSYYDYWYAFNNKAMPFAKTDIYELEAITDEQMEELAEKAAQGELIYGEFEKLTHTATSGEGIYVMGCLYCNERTDEIYALISYFLTQSEAAAPVIVVLRNLSSGESIDLLNEYYMLDRFLAR